MRKTELLSRLAVLEEGRSRLPSAKAIANDPEISGESSLAELLADLDGSAKNVPLLPSERVEYWQRKVDEAEELIAQK